MTKLEPGENKCFKLEFDNIGCLHCIKKVEFNVSGLQVTSYPKEIKKGSTINKIWIQNTSDETVNIFYQSFVLNRVYCISYLFFPEIE